MLLSSGAINDTSGNAAYEWNKKLTDRPSVSSWLFWRKAEWPGRQLDNDKKGHDDLRKTRRDCTTCIAAYADAKEEKGQESARLSDAGQVSG